MKIRSHFLYRYTARIFNAHLIVISFFIINISCGNNYLDKNIKSEASVLHSKTSEKFFIKRGINISHWLSQNSDIGPNRSKVFTEKDVELIASLHYDHLRIPVDEEHLWDVDSSRIFESFELLHKAFSWCKKYGLSIVLDLHQIRSHTFNSTKNSLWDSKKEQFRFVQMWMQLSEEFADYPVDFLAYELLNEAVADNPGDWNKLFLLTIDSLRRSEPNRKIIIGSNRWQSPDTFHDLVLPEKDTNIILSFHFYTPFLFTHYKTHWTNIGKYTGAVSYPGQTIKSEYIKNYDSELAMELEQYTSVQNKETLLQCIQEPIEFAKKHKLQLYCGEFGCIPNVYRSDRLKWYSDVCEIFEANNIAWANWDYKGAFSIYNLQTGNLDEKLIEILTNTTSK